MSRKTVSLDSFLACLNKVQRELLHYSQHQWSLRSQKCESFNVKFFCDGQGTDRGAIPSIDRSCLSWEEVGERGEVKFKIP